MKQKIVMSALIGASLFGCGVEEHYDEYPDDPNEAEEQAVGERAEREAEREGTDPLDSELRGAAAERRAELHHEAADDEGVVDPEE
ncbi:MAG: hypothetical protein RLP09_12650 [Sandaracinaceae bacterium]|nr:hypothetical protein [Myxococcales bacterium]